MLGNASEQEPFPLYFKLNYKLLFVEYQES